MEVIMYLNMTCGNMPFYPIYLQANLSEKKGHH